MLSDKYPDEVKRILAKYPPDRKQSAVMPLLHLVQLEKGFVDRHQMREIAEICGITETDVAEIVGFYTLYHDEKAGKYRMQVCTDLPCALRGADEFMQNLCGNLGIKVGETTADGIVTLEAVTCLAACDKAPMFQIQGPDGIKYHENMNVDRTMELISILKHANKEVK